MDEVDETTSSYRINGTIKMTKTNITDTKL